MSFFPVLPNLCLTIERHTPLIVLRDLPDFLYHDLTDALSDRRTHCCLTLIMTP
jgi:hypothetical protein